MAFEEDFARHVDQIKARLPHIHGEEASKQSLVIPLFHVLGYDVWNPLEVQPEYGADFSRGPKKGQVEKVDYALKINGEPVIFVECKAADVTLDAHDAQLSRYFNTTPSVRVAILTNGVRLKVFTDLQQQNIMDEKPWMDFDIRSAKQAEIDALKKFRKTEFTADQIVGLAEEMVYYNVLVPFIASQLRDPGEDLVRLVTAQIPSIKRIDKKVVDRLTPILRKAIQSAILDHVARSFNTQAQPEPTSSVTTQPLLDAAATPGAPAAAATRGAPAAVATRGAPVAVATRGAPVAAATRGAPMATALAVPAVAAPAVAAPAAVAPAAVAPGVAAPAIEGSRDGILTTPEELEVYGIVSKIVREKLPDAIVQYKDAKSYFNIMQKGLHKWFIRLGIEKAPFWIAFRHIKPETARTLCPGIEVADGGHHGDAKVAIKGVADVVGLKPIILASYEAELARVGGPIEPTPSAMEG
jgi:predicted type IV restriction endonuclease